MSETENIIPTAIQGSDLEGRTQPTDTTVGRSDPMGTSVSPSVVPVKKIPTPLLFLIPVLIIVAVIAIYVLLQARTMYQQTVAVASPIPSPTPIASADPTEDWQIYTDSVNGFSFKYPKEYSLGNYSLNDPSTPQLINNRIDWYISKFGAMKCKGDCPIIQTTENENISQNIQATKIEGWIGGIGGEIPQSYLTYEMLLPSGEYLDINLWELLRGKSAMSENYPLDRKPGQINSTDIDIFNQILSTFKFTDQ